MLPIIIFWLSIVLIFFSYFGYPIILVILGSFKSKKIRKTEIIPSVTLLVPVYNEEKVIRKKLENSLNLDYPKDKLEVIVASESNDKTNEIVKKYENKAVKLFAYSGREGKQFTIYRTIPKCSGEIVVLTDVNGMFEKSSIRKLVRNFNDTSVGCVSGELRYVNSKKGMNKESEGLYWKYEIWIKKLESRIQSVLGANGSIYAIRKNLYSPLSEHRGDDFELAVRIAQEGYWSILEPEAVSFENFSETIGKEFDRRVRIVGWVWRSALILLKESIKKGQLLLVFQLISHKILRWLVGLFLAMIFFTNFFLLDRPLYLGLLLFQIAFYSLGILGYFKEKKKKKSSRWINIIYYFCAINLAALLGVFKSALGKQRATWQKVR